MRNVCIKGLQTSYFARYGTMSDTNSIPAKIPAHKESPVELPSDAEKNVSLGVQNIEAVTQVWTKSALVTALIFIWLIYFVEGLLTSTQGALIPYVISDYASHSLIPTVSIISTILGGVTNFTIAKILDVFGRPTGFNVSLLIATLGLIMLAACSSVELYAAALVFYTVGNTGVQYTLSILIADTTSLRNRGLIQTLASIPYIITCWLGGPVSSAFLAGSGWPWAFGMFSILVPVISLPLVVMLFLGYTKAVKQNLASAPGTNRGVWQSVYYYCTEFDVLGVILLSGGAALFLLPFNLYGLQTMGWASPMIICMLVIGVALLVLFVLWERFFAATTFMPYSLLSDRTIIGSCLLSATLFFSYSCWVSYFPSFLQVVNELSITEASYVLNGNTVGSTIFALVAGLAIRYTGHFKLVTLFINIPLAVIGTGLMIYFSRPHQNVGYLVMCMLLNAFGTGFMTVSDEIAALSVVPHQQIAATVAILGFFGNIGAAIGLAVAGAIWQNVFPLRLATYLPPDELSNLAAIYADITQQLSYEPGSQTRLAIQRAYGDAQSAILVAATSVWAVGIVAVVMWKNVDVRSIIQTKGQVI